MSHVLVWATDIHLDHCEAEVRHTFYREISARHGDAICLSGDLAESHNVVNYLQEMAEALQKPIYFVLGNHDYYHSSLENVRQMMSSVNKQTPLLHWLPATGVIALSAHTALIGHDSWADGRHGNFHHSSIRLKDYRLIQEFVNAGESGRLALLNHLGDESAQWLANHLPDALAHYTEVYLLMHPPPFRETCLYGSEIADDNWAPHFICKAVGDLLLQLMPDFPKTQLTVLAGHTHNGCDLQIMDNLRVCVGAAEYGQPRLSQCFSYA